MEFRVLVDYSRRIKRVSSKNAKIGLIVDLMRRFRLPEAGIGISYLAGRIRQGRLNIQWAGLSGLVQAGRRRGGPVDLIEVDRALEDAKKSRGRSKLEVLKPLFERLSPAERRYLVSLIAGEVQQGAAEGLVKMALARRFGLDDEAIERAYLQQPDIARLFALLLARGQEAVHALSIQIFSPVKPMLAQVAPSLDDVLADNDAVALEHKLDGIRIQVHRDQDEVRIFSRHLRDITDHFPELVDLSRRLPVEQYILDGEAIGIDPTGKTVDFQTLARRTTRKREIAAMQRKIPVVPRFFDALYVDGEDLTTRPYSERVRILDRVVRDRAHRVTRLRPASAGQARVFYADSLKQGSEGVMLKILDSQYRPGKRGKLWFKVKSAHTIDCVILAAEWGHGRRRGLLSNLHLGILDETRTRYLMVGKTFKGLTDQMLRWLTDNLPRYKVHEDDRIVHVKPRVVVEVAFNEVQKSPRYDSGMALRFARVKRIRRDKTAAEIDTVVDLHRNARWAAGPE